MKFFVTVVTLLILAGCSDASGNVDNEVDYSNEDYYQLIGKDYNEEDFVTTDYSLNGNIVVYIDTDGLCTMWSRISISSDDKSLTVHNPCSSLGGKPYVVVDDLAIEYLRYITYEFQYDENDLDSYEQLNIEVGT